YNYDGLNFSFEETEYLNFSDGFNTINVYGIDKYRGNVSYVAGFFVDNLSPEIYNFSIYPKGIVYEDFVYFDLFGKGNLFADIKLDNESFTLNLINGTNNFKPLSVGNYNVTFYSNDSFGRMSEIKSSEFDVFLKS